MGRIGAQARFPFRMQSGSGPGSNSRLADRDINFYRSNCLQDLPDGPSPQRVPPVEPPRLGWAWNLFPPQVHGVHAAVLPGFAVIGIHNRPIEHHGEPWVDRAGRECRIAGDARRQMAPPLGLRYRDGDCRAAGGTGKQLHAGVLHRDRPLRTEGGGAGWTFRVTPFPAFRRIH